jgi:hypothetical protein
METSLNPLEILDRTVSSYTGGVNTDQYYAQIYANEQASVPTQTLIIGTEPTPTATVQSAPAPTASVPAHATGGSESPIDVFLRTTQQDGAQKTPSAAQKTVPPNNTYTQSVGVPTGQTQTVDVSPVSVFGFLLNAAFSVAVVMSVIGIMFVVYVMLRTRQLHHHEHHVKELVGTGGGGHDAHASVPQTTHSSHHVDEHDVHEQDEQHDAHDEPDEHEEPTETEEYEREPAHEVHEDRAREVQLEKDTPAPLPASHTAHETAEYSSRLAAIKKDASSDDEDAWYTALMDVNLLLEDVLESVGYEGTTVKDMLGSDQAKSLATRDVALEAEAEFQALISGEKPITKDDIQHLVQLYTKVYKELGVV